MTGAESEKLVSADTAVGIGAGSETENLPDALRNVETPLAWEEADDDVEDFPPTGAVERQSWGWAWGYAGIGVAIAVGVALLIGAVGWGFMHWSDKTPSAGPPFTIPTETPPSSSPAVSPPQSTVAAEPPSTTTTVQAAPPLDGTYRLTNKFGETLMWDGFRSACRPSGCTASGLRLDGDDPTVAYSAEFGPPFFLRWGDGHWQGAYRYERDCITADGHSSRGRETESLTFSLVPQSDGTYQGTVTLTAVKADPTPACRPQGDVYTMAVTATRTGLPPVGLVADPPTG